MRFCVKCGRELPRDQLIQGYCVDCFIKHVGLFERKPTLEITICPKCYSWLFRGKWLAPTSIDEIVKSVGLNELSKIIRRGLQLVDLDVISTSQDTDEFRVKLRLHVKTETTTFTTLLEVPGRVVHRVCPNCIFKGSGKYTHLVQIRFTRRSPPRSLVEDLERLLEKLPLQDGVVSVKYAESGIDIELDDATIARKIVQAVVRGYSAKSTTSFKATRFDHNRGVWRGVLTYSLRIPVFDKGDVVIYRNNLYIVEDLKKNRITLFNPSSSVREEIPLSSYWTGELKTPTRVEIERYIVRELREHEVVAVNENTRSQLVFKRARITPRIKVGDTVLLIKADDIEAIIVGSESELLR